MHKIRMLLTVACVGVATLLSATNATAAPTADVPAAAKTAVTDQAGAVGPLAYYTWQNERSGKCLDQNWSGGVKRQTALVYSCNGTANQRWQLEAYSDGTYIIRNQRSGECLHQVYSGTTATTAMQVLTCTGLSNQRWWVTVFTDGTVQFKNGRSGWVLDQSYSGGVERTNAVAYPFNGGLNQYWY